jgi:hypothetical protein
MDADGRIRFNGRAATSVRPTVERALAAVMVCIDLNPVRAGIADKLEDPKHTSRLGNQAASGNSGDWRLRVLACLRPQLPHTVSFCHLTPDASTLTAANKKMTVPGFPPPW